MAAVGLAVLLGWILGVPLLKSLTAGLPSMKAYTASAFVLTGVALLVLARGRPTRALQVTASACAAVVGLFGLVTLGEYAFGGLVVAGVRLDTAVFADTGTYPGRASPQTAMAFVTVAGALLAAGRSRGWARTTFRVFLALLGVVVVGALVGYAFGVDYLRGVSTVTGMAVHTALALVVVWVGLAWLPARSGVPEYLRTPRPSAVLVRRFAPVVVFGPVVLGLLRLEGQRVHLYDLRFGVALFTLAVILGVGGALLVGARSLDRLDDRRAWAEERYRATMDSMLDPCVLLQPVRDGQARIVDFVYTYANPAACAYNQLSFDELVGARMLHLLPGHVGSGLLDMYADVVETGRPLALDDFVYEQDLLGQEQHYDVRASRVGDGLSYIWRDVTERSRSRRQLAASEARFRQLVERAPDATLVVDGAGLVVLVSRQATELCGYETDELVGQPVETLVPEGLRDAHTAHREGFLAQPAVRPMGVGYTLNLRHKDGHEIPVEISLSPLDDKPNGQQLVAAAVRDITDRMRADAAVRASEERFRRVFDEAPIGMALVGLDQRFERVNPQLSRIIGRSAEELEGVPVADVTHPDDMADDKAGFDGLLAGRIDAYRTQKRYLRPDGSAVWGSLSVGLLRDDAGRPADFFGQVLDISDQKRIEGELQHLADHDHLTGLFNRRRFEEELDREVARSRRHGTPAAVLVLDIDRFKEANDVLGHSAGDRLITGVAGGLPEPSARHRRHRQVRR